MRHSLNFSCLLETQTLTTRPGTAEIQATCIKAKIVLVYLFIYLFLQFILPFIDLFITNLSIIYCITFCYSKVLIPKWYQMNLR